MKVGDYLVGGRQHFASTLARLHQPPDTVHDLLNSVTTEDHGLHITCYNVF